MKNVTIATALVAFGRSLRITIDELSAIGLLLSMMAFAGVLIYQMAHI